MSSPLPLNPKIHLYATAELFKVLARHRQLTWELTKREIGERYAGQVLGTAWAVGHPIFLMGLYVFVFSYIFGSAWQADAQMPRSYATLILSGLIPWLTFTETMSKGSSVITANASLVKQVVFPLETLPVKGVIASLFTQGVATTILLIYMLAVERSWPWTIVLLPALVALQTLAMIGVGYILASVGVYFRDLKDVVQVFNTAGLYLAPILFVPSWIAQVPTPFRVLIWVNPFSHLVWCYHDLLFYGRFDHVASWLITAVLAAGVFYIGFRVFLRLKPQFGNTL